MSNIHHRYHLSDGESLLETAATRREAFSLAARMASRSGLPVKVFDSMARYGRPDRWTIHPGAEYRVAIPDGVR